MKEVDRAAVEDFGIPALVLMENAAIGLTDAITDNYPRISSAAILCGPGNNGGDGLALARHLTIRGYHVEVSLLTAGGGLSDDAQTQLNICRNQGIAMREFGPDESLHPAIESARSLDIVVDALFGIGLTRPLSGHFAEAVESLNSIAAPKIAVDLPSGLDGSSAEIPGLHFGADLTVTFGAPKIAHVFPPAAESVGEVVVADLGVPLELIERAPGDLHLLVGDEVGAHLMPRPLSSHKGDYGHVVLMAGSEGKAGAAILAARSAVRAGAGLVTAAVPRSIVHTVDLGSIESMTLALPVTDRGGLDRESVERVLDFAADKDVLALGPGLGTEPSTVEVIRSVVLGSELPLVVDADGLNAFADDLQSLATRRGESVLTPHPGELARLLSMTAQEVQADRVAAARSAAERSQSVVVLKGYRSLIATPGGRVFVNSTGNPGMASGGTGDVLTGLIAGLLGQGYAPLVAAQLGVYLHGLAGDLAAEEAGQIGLAARDVLRGLPKAFRQLGQ
jgi:NAD(P)H-hydrate epimerase